MRFDAIVAVKGHMMRDQAADRRTLADNQFQRQLMTVQAGPADHFKHSALITVKPAAALGRHLEGGGHIESLPAPVRLHEYPLAMASEPAQIAMGGRQKPVDADVTLRDHRMEHAIHPDRGGENGLIRHQGGARPQDVSMGPENSDLLGPEHDMTARASEKGQQTRFAALLLAALGTK